MSDAVPMNVIAHIHTDFPEKFGIPRQSGLVNELKSYIIFEPEYRNPNALRGLDGYSHIWLLWQFSEAVRSGWQPTVRPPRLGGNKRMGVFATRSPFRPNAIGLSCVKLDGMDLHTPNGPILHISGADMMNNTPIFDIKPYLSYTDSRPDALSGFSSQISRDILEVNFPRALLEQIPERKRSALLGILAQDPRPAYQNDPERIYKLSFAGYNVHFTVLKNKLTVEKIEIL